MTMLKSDVQSVRLFHGYSTAVWWSLESRPTAAVQPVCEHGEPGHCLIETKKGPDIERMVGTRCCRNSVLPVIRTIYLHNQSIKIRAWYAQNMKFQWTPLLEKCWTFTQKTVSAHRKQVNSAAGNCTFWQHFVNIENLLNGTIDLYKIWWQYSKFIKACAWLIMCNVVQVCTYQSQTFRGHLFGDTLYMCRFWNITITGIIPLKGAKCHLIEWMVKRVCPNSGMYGVF